jgi:hypothetical protein
MIAIEPALKFNQTLLHPNDEANVHLNLRERGYAIVGGVFDRDSVDAYVEQIKGAIRETGNYYYPLELPAESPLSVTPLYAPRLRQVMPGCFWPVTDRHRVQCYRPVWSLKPSKPDPRMVHDWHKDFDHRVVACADGGYQYPLIISAGMYFADMTVDHGPTYVIPGSHRDPNLSPYRGAKEEPFLCGKGDIILWDQRTWHRASPRTVEGIRILALFEFICVPVVKPFPPTPALVEALRNAKDSDEEVLFGGVFGKASLPKS